MIVERCKTQLVSITAQIKAEAIRLGFDAFGIAPAIPVDEAVRTYLSDWLDAGHHAGMDYMANHFEQRCNPALLVEGTRSVISVALNYYPRKMLSDDGYQFAWYAYGEDYHVVVKAKLMQLLEFVRSVLPETEGRAFCDTAPLLERYWAWRCGLGWIGKHTQLVIPNAGSAFFLGELLINQRLVYDHPRASQCGNCTRCLDACPTHALQQPYQLDARRCLSYLTIENRGEISSVVAGCLGNCIYGCDRCLQACPYLRFATPTREERLQPKEAFLRMRADDWRGLTKETYQQLFKGSAVKRAKYEGLMRNIHAVSKQQTGKK